VRAVTPDGGGAVVILGGGLTSMVTVTPMSQD
jgi:hypothetical protein